jgi:hypothetical protein
MKRWIAGLALAVAAFGAWALPTLQQVQEEVRLGHLANAESMMREVVAARPESARAHYVYAEILARNGNFAEATEQARLARAADPKITFTDPEKFRAFEQLLQRERDTATSRARQAPSGSVLDAPAVRLDTPAPQPEPRTGSGVPGWIWLVGIGVVVFVLWRAAQRRRAAVAGAGSFTPYGSAAGSPGMGPGYGPQSPGGVAYGQPGQPGHGPYGPPTAPAGSGMLGTGLAAAGGFAAGMLADRMLHGRPDQPSSGALDHLGPGAGSLDTLSDPAATELESRPVDFGAGGDDWGGGDATSADGGSFDAGGGDDWN